MKELESKDIQKQFDSLRDYLSDLTGSVSKIANRRWRDVRGRGEEAEAIMQENFAASLVAALGVGILVGYLIRRGIH